MVEGFKFDAYSPAEIADRVEKVGVAKANLDAFTTIVLAVLAGAFIGMGAELATLAGTDSGLGFGPNKLLMGAAFSLGLILVVVAGAELFTGNNLIVMAWASRHISTGQLLRNWVLVLNGNLIGSLATAAFVYLTQIWTMDGHKVGATALLIANSKVGLPFMVALTRGILCNTLVCLAVWLCFGARSVVDKILAIVFPITAFVASGFEHSIANMYFIPLGLMLKGDSSVLEAAGKTAADMTNLTVWGFFVRNLIPVTIGNIIGGGVMVAAVYWFAYLRRSVD